MVPTEVPSPSEASIPPVNGYRVLSSRPQSWAPPGARAESRASGFHTNSELTLGKQHSFDWQL